MKLKTNIKHLNGSIRCYQEELSPSVIARLFLEAWLRARPRFMISAWRRCFVNYASFRDLGVKTEDKEGVVTIQGAGMGWLESSSKCLRSGEFGTSSFDCYASLLCRFLK